MAPFHVQEICVMSFDKPPDLTEQLFGERKLIAVVYADMVGYSRLIGVDDAGTLARLKRLRINLIDPAIAEHRGRVVQTGGDSLLIVFDSIDGAVRCALKVQQQVPIRDECPSSDQAIRFRMGINIGDAIPDGTDLHGEAVNVAARLQAECPPGAICVSRSVRDHVHGRLGLQFEERGALALKNIARPVEAFVVRLNPEVRAPAVLPLSGNEGGSLPLPDRPSIAVLPFINMSRDTDQEFFADGVAEDLITDLSRNRLLFVIARNSSFSYKGQAIDPRRVAEQLGVRYLVEGSVRRETDRIRITAQLIDAGTGRHVWAERYDRNLADVFEVQDEISRAIVQAVVPAIAQAEQQRARARPPSSLSAWEAYQRGLSEPPSTDHLSVAITFLQQAVNLDPGFAPAHAMLAWRYVTQITLGDRPLAEGVKLAEAEARIALQLDPYGAFSHAAMAWILTCRDDPEAALEEAEVAIALNPNDAHGHMIKGRVLVFTGRRAEGRNVLATALRLDPRGPTAIAAMIHSVIAYYLEGDYSAAVTVARRVMHAFPVSPRPHLLLAAALGQLGQLDEARLALAKATNPPSSSYFDFITRSRPPHYHLAGDHAHLLEGLRKAGWRADPRRPNHARRTP
jgi:adenylate cyclase